jgi:ATP-binding cassette subfamily B protein
MAERSEFHNERVIDVEGEHPVRSVGRLLAGHRRRLIPALLMFILKDSPQWIMPVLAAAIIDIVVAGGPVRDLLIYGIIALAVLVQNYPSHVLWTKLFSGSVRSIGADLRNLLASRLQGLSIGFHSRASASVIQTKVVRDVENIETMLQQASQPLLSAVTVLIGAITVTAITAPQFIVVFAFTVPVAAVLYSFMRLRSTRKNELFRLEVEQFSARVGEMATLMPITRAHGLEQIAEARVAQAAEGVRSAGFTLDLLNGRFGSVAWVAMQVLGFLTLLVAAFASITGLAAISAGQVVLLSTYFTILTGAVTGLLMLVPIFSRGIESVRSIAEILQEPDLEHNAGKRVVERVRGEIRLEDVTYRFENKSRPALDGVSLTIAEGETVALVGPSGSGKSTLLSLVLGFLRPVSGRILLDGVDMEELDMRTFRTSVSVVPQESVLFEGSIRENITYGLTGVPEAQIMDALRDANALEIIDAMPRGWDTVVGERGARLSGGQRQRLAIARALVRDPRVLLLDEATSALDSESELKVRSALARLMQGRTTLVVAHRLSTIRSAHRIVVLDHGRIVEMGTHEQLLAASGRYAALHKAQNTA